MTTIRRALVVSGGKDGFVVEILDGPLAGRRFPAVVYGEFGEAPAVGDTVLVNSVGVEMGLGTGGMVFVLPSCGGDAPVNDDHFMKLPYTPLQFPAIGGDLPDDISGTPVVVLPLHSHLAVACAAVRDLLPAAKVAFVWHEGGSLAVGSSRLARELRSRGMLDSVVSAGNCFGGDTEEPNIYAGLLAAGRADVILCGIGPGIIGSGRAFGHGGMSAAVAANAAAALGGDVVLCPRISGADGRERHRGVSHHTRQALAATLSPCHVPVPGRSDGSWFGDLPEHHEYVDVSYPAAGLEERFGLTFESMGRRYRDDPVFFDAAAAAVKLAVRISLPEGGSG